MVKVKGAKDRKRRTRRKKTNDEKGATFRSKHAKGTTSVATLFAARRDSSSSSSSDNESDDEQVDEIVIEPDDDVVEFSESIEYCEKHSDIVANLDISDEDAQKGLDDEAGPDDDDDGSDGPAACSHSHPSRGV